MWTDREGAGQFGKYESLEIEGRRMLVPLPDAIPGVGLVEREDIVEKALGAWVRLDSTPPLSFRLFGPPGAGKNAVVYNLAGILRRDLYIINGHEKLRLEDVACSPTTTSEGTTEYVASPLFAAMLRGGICFFDEIGKAPASALDPLASVLDDRRTLACPGAAIHLKAHRDFLFCAALNEDEETDCRIPAFVSERTRPAIRVDYPCPKVLGRILRTRFPAADDIWISALLQELKGRGISARVAINLLGYAYRMSLRDARVRLRQKDAARYLGLAGVGLQYVNARSLPAAGAKTSEVRMSGISHRPSVLQQMG